MAFYLLQLGQQLPGEWISSCAGVFYGAVQEVSVLLLRSGLPGGDAPLQMQHSWAVWICCARCVFFIMWWEDE